MKVREVFRTQKSIGIVQATYSVLVLNLSFGHNINAHAVQCAIGLQERRLF
jgi:hypothetical protein